MDLEKLRASDGTGPAALANIEADRSIGATTIDVDNVENWPQEFIVVTGTLDANGYLTPASMSQMVAHLDGGNIEIDSFVPGYPDVGNTEGQVAIIKQTVHGQDELINELEDEGDRVRSGWFEAGETWEYSSWSATTRIGVLTVPTDATTKYNVKNRIAITQATGGTKYGIVVKVAATELTIFFPSGTTLNNEAITNPRFSPFDSPLGFDSDPTLWQLELSSSSGRSTTSTTFATLTDALTIGIGAWEVGWKGDVYINISTSPASPRYGTIILTSTGTEEYADLTANIRLKTGAAAEQETGYTARMATRVKLTAQKTLTFYGKISTTGPQPTLTLGGNTQATKIFARCAYL